MKRYWILICLLAVLSLSCKKDKDNKNYYFSCTIDGVKKDFSVQALATLDATGGGEFLVLGGFGSTTTTENFSLAISNNPSGKLITPRTYTDDWTEFNAVSIYLQDGNSYESGATLYSQSIATNTPLANHLKIVITSISDGTIVGTVSGDYHLDTDPSGAKKTITDGMFFLPLQRTP